MQSPGGAKYFIYNMEVVKLKKGLRNVLEKDEQ